MLGVEEAENEKPKVWGKITAGAALFRGTRIFL